MKRALIVVSLLLASIPAFGASVYFTEDFNGPSISSDLEFPPGSYVLDSGVIRRNNTVADFIAASGSSREYVRTVANGYESRDFIAEVSFTLLDPVVPGGSILFFGIGPGIPYPSYFNEPNDSFVFRIHTLAVQFNSSGKVDGVPLAPDFTNPDATWSLPGADFFRFSTNSGIQRARITKDSNQLTFSIDQDFSGVFSADRQYTIPDVTAFPWFSGSDNRVFFGVGDPVNSFDDFVIRPLEDEAEPIPEPSTLLLLGSGLVGLAGYRRGRRR